MSLFKARDWWSTVVEDECDLGCLLISNINNEHPPKDKIIVGGFSGTLRIFDPQGHTTEDGTISYDYRPDHVLLETTLNDPIIQLAAGRFVSGSDEKHLLVLYPDHLAVYNLVVTTGQTGYGHQAKLNTAYQHMFQRHAHSLVTGHFGSVKGKDLFAVLSLDGCITVYEQESIGFCCFLPGFLLPGPWGYMPKSDSFIVVGSDWSLQCYKYQSLATSNENEKDSNNKSGGRRLAPEWTYQVGEAVLDIIVLSPQGYPPCIAILTHHAFLCFKDNGVLKFVKKLEYNPSSFAAYYIESQVHLCIASHTQTLLVYRETELKWASQLPFVPVALIKANLQGIAGVLVGLSDSGEVQAMYLGTDPSLFVAPPTETREINYDLTDKELAHLHKIIKASTKDAGSLVAMSRGDSDLMVMATIGSSLEAWTGPSKVQDPDGLPSVPVVIRLTAHTPLNAVRVNIHCHKPLAVTQDTFVLRTICDTSQIMVKFYLEETYIPSSLDVQIITSYIGNNGNPRIITTELNLPLRLVVKPCAPSKEADHKITIIANKPAVNLPELFPEFVLDGSVNTALGLQYYEGPEVTILSSRTTNRYRLQSDSLASLWLILSEVRRRLNNYWNSPNRRNEEELTLSIASSLPMQDLFSEIDAHFLRRKKHQELQNQLIQRTTQFRAVQRRLLTKFKDKTPTPLTNLDNLLDGTYKQILHITDVINDNMRGLEEDGCQLSCVIRLVLELVKLQSGMSENQFSLLSAAFSPLVQPSMEQGWEEVTDAGVTFILRTVLGKGSQDAVTVPELTMPNDTTKLKKHVGALLDKIIKGGAKLSLDNEKNKKDTLLVPHDQDISLSGTIIDDDTSGSFDDGDYDDAQPLTSGKNNQQVPLGSRLGEDRARSARVRSARAMSARTPAQSNNVSDMDSGNLKGEPKDQRLLDDNEGLNETKDTNEHNHISGNTDNHISDIDMSHTEQVEVHRDNHYQKEEEEEEQEQEEGNNHISNDYYQKKDDTNIKDDSYQEDDSNIDYTESNFQNDNPPVDLIKDIEALKKETIKENSIESPANPFETREIDEDDIW